MATQQLTERQRQVKKLLDQKKTPAEIATALGITENAVYQQRRRIKAASGSAAKAAAPKKAAASKAKATGRRTKSTGTVASRRRSNAGEVSGSVAVAASAPAERKAEPRSMTPLQAVRTRRVEIESDLKESGRRVDEMRKRFEQETEAHERLLKNREHELKQLQAAEEALTGKAQAPTKGQNGSGSKSAARKAAKSAPAPAQGAPAPVGGGAATLAAHITGTTPENAAADAQAAAAVEPTEQTQPDAGPVEAPREREVELARAPEEERPGVPTMPEFEEAVPEGDEEFGAV